MVNKHTPGPWQHTGNGDIQGIEDNGYGRGPVDVCSVYLRTVEGRTEANAALIAAAPDLLSVLELLVAGIEDGVSDTYVPLIKARAAIAKATGGAV